MSMSFSRRNFLKTGISSLGFGVLPSPVRGASDLLKIGVIGTGERGVQLLRELLPLKNVQVSGVCDLDSRACKVAADWTGNTARITTDYTEMLRWYDLDAVIIATPDVSHADIALAALAAGKDVYLETPLTRTPLQAEQIVALAGAQARLVQVASPLINHPRVDAALEAVQSGLLGQIVQVTIAIQTHSVQPGNLTTVPSWTMNRAGANLSRIFAPYLDVIHQVLGKDTPQSATANGGVYLRTGSPNENPDVFHGALIYPPGVLVGLSFGALPDAFQFHGTRQSFDLHNLLPAYGDSHLDAWLTSLRSRTIPPADAAVGLRHVVALDLLERAYWTGVRQHISQV